MPETRYSKIITVGVLTELIVIFIITFTHETNGIQTLNSCVWGGVRSYKIKKYGPNKTTETNPNEALWRPVFVPSLGL